MADHYLDLETDVRREALEFAASESGRPAYLLEKDIWVVWTLRTLFGAPVGASLVFKGGTSLSKAYGVIRRFSEDVDLTYDIRDIVPDLIGDSANPLPANRSQEKRWSAEIRRRLAEWTRNTAAPYLAEALGAVEPGGTVRIDDADLFVRYAPLNEGTAYVRPEVKLEFGARSTGEPSARMPGNQLYIPDLAMDLRERFRTHTTRHASGLSPAAQAVLFHRLLRLDVAATTPSLIATRLHYSAMSIGRAFNDLIDSGLAHTERYGKERHIRFKAEGRELFDAAHDLLRSPIRTEKFVRDGHVAPPLKHSGESALAELTDLSPPPLDAFAVAASDWKTIAQTRGFVETGRGQAAHIVETWAYDPAGLSTARTVDPLSLYAHFRNHRDERVSMAAERLLKEIAW